MSKITLRFVPNSIVVKNIIRQFSVAIIACLFLTIKISAQDVQKNISGELIIFHAGSLSVPFKEITAEFNKLYPNVKVLLESAGSVASARKITDLNRQCDIMASADYSVIDKMLIPKYADWNIRFAGNEMAIVYHDKSRYAKMLTKDNWYELLMKKDVAFGRADPNSDPCGYRTVLTLKLAEKYYKKPGLTDKFLNKDLNMMRPKEVDLVALLETNNLDYIFLYKSVAIQHNLKYLTLPDEINLKNAALADKYSSVSTEISGNEPGKKTSVTGEPMVYGITMLRNAPHKQAAIAFLKFMLDKNKGLRIMNENGQPPVENNLTDDCGKLPLELRQMICK